VGFFSSIIGMLLGSLAPQLVTNRGHSIAHATHPHGAHPHGRHGSS
jgi:hypothetical protein